MAEELEAVVERVVEAIALTGNYGLSIAKVRKAIVSAQRTDADTAGNHEATPHIDGAVSEATEEQGLIQTAWVALGIHPDIDRDHEDSAIRPERDSGDTDDEDVHDRDSRSSPITRQTSNKRLFATVKRQWHAVADHDVDQKRIPRREFELLSVIAAHGSIGVAHSKAARLIGQDKHSVPRRTDNLAEKGYIVKTPIALNGTKTSLLRLKKLVNSAEEPVVEPLLLRTTTPVKVARKAKPKEVPAPAPTSAPTPGPVPEPTTLDLGNSFDMAVALIKEQTNSLLAIADLGAGIGLQNTKADNTLLLDFVRCLADTKCITKCSARPRDDEGAVRQTEIRCVQLVRDPSDDEKSDWLQAMSVSRTPAKVTRTDTVKDNVDESVAQAEQYEATNLSLPNLIFDIVDAAGAAGITSKELLAEIRRPMSRPSLDGFVSKMIDSQTDSDVQSFHISRKRRGYGRGVHYLYRTVANKNVPTRSTAESPSADVRAEHHISRHSTPEITAATKRAPRRTEQWGFAKPAPELFADEDGRASLAECQPHIHSTETAEAPTSTVNEVVQHKRGPRMRRLSSFNDDPNAEVVELPKPIVRHRITTEKDQEEFEQWAKRTAEQMVRYETKQAKLTVDSVMEGDDSADATPVNELPDDELDYRIAEIEADLVCRDRPGIYINPPGAKETKAHFFMQKGRPRNALIAVIKTEKLATLPWFRADEPRLAPLASRRRTSRFVSYTLKKAGKRKRANDAANTAGDDSDTSAVVEGSERADSVKPTSPELNPTLRQTSAYSHAAGPSADQELASAAAPRPALRPRKPTVSGTTIESVANEAVQQTEHETATLQAASLTAESEQPAPNSGLTTYSKDYVLAHPDEEFHHAGNGKYKRGPRPNKRRRRGSSGMSARAELASESAVVTSETLEMAVAQEAEQASIEENVLEDARRQLADVPEPAGPLASLSKGEKPIDTTQSTFDKAYVTAHGGPSGFHHVGGGRWRRGPRTTKFAPSATIDEASPSKPLVPEEQAAMADELQDAVASIETVPSSPQAQPEGSQAELPASSRETIADGGAAMSMDGGLNTGTPPLSCRSPGPSDADRRMSQGKQNAVRTRTNTTKAPRHVGRPAASRKPSLSAGSDSDFSENVNNRNLGLARQRTAMILDIVNQCGSIFPGPKELWYPLATAWEKAHGHLPDRHAFNTSVKSLVHMVKLKKVTFSFLSKRGTVETRSILLLPGVEVAPERLEQVKRAIIAAFPAPFVPDEVDVSEDLRTQARNSTTKKHGLGAEGEDDSYFTHRGIRQKKTDEFPVTEGLVVQRTQQGMELLEIERQRNRVRQSEFQKRKKAREEHDDMSALVSLKLPAGLLEAVEAGGPSNTEWLRLFPGQSFHPPSGTHGTKSAWPATVELEEIKDKAFRRPKHTATAKPRPQEIGEPPTHEIIELAPEDAGNEVATPVKGSTYDTAYVLAHPDIEMHHVGNGRYKLGPRPARYHPLTNEQAPAASAQQGMGIEGKAPGKEPSYDLAYVLAHPDQELYHAGNGRYKLGQRPIKRRGGRPRKSVPDASVIDFDTPAPETAIEPAVHGHHILPSQAAHSRPHLEWPPQPAKAARMPPVPSLSEARTPAKTRTPRKPTSRAPVVVAPLSPRPSPSNDVPSEPQRIPTSRSGRPLYKSKKRLEGFVETPAEFEMDWEPNIYDAPSPAGQPIYKSRKRQANLAELLEDADLEMQATEQPVRKKQKTVPADPPLFVHGDELVVALAVVRTLCSGIEQGRTPWELVAHAMSYKYDGDLLRLRWQHLSKSRADEVLRLQDVFRESFLEAYEAGTLPPLDFQDLAATNWPALVEWTKSSVLPLKAKSSQASKTVSFPASRAELRDGYDLDLPENVHAPDGNRYFDAVADYIRSDTALSLIHGHSLNRPHDQLKQPANHLMLLKSWCRATSMTKPSNYDAEAAAKKVGIFPPALIKQATDELIDSQIISAEKQGRQLPGRNFYMSRAALKQFHRWPKADYLRDVAAARGKVMASFALDDKLQLSFHIDDFETVVLTNLVAQGYLKMTTILPPRNDDPDAPLPRFGIWGVDDPAALYNSHAANKDRYRFPITYEKTPAFSASHGLKFARIPMQVQPFQGELGARIPLWIDIHGSLIDDAWDMVVRSVLHLLVYRPGATAQSMEKAHEGKLWAWEIDLTLLWMEEVGLAISFGPGKEENGVWKGGWRASEWWYCAFAPEVATWQAPGARPNSKRTP